MSYVSPEKLQRFWNRVKPIMASKLTASGISNNDTTTASGYVLDARMGKTHGDEIDALATRVTSLETSFPAGCSTIAAAVTAEGVTTASNASPSTIAANISQIRNGGNAAASDILSGKTAYSGKMLRTGSMQTLTSANFTGTHSGSTAGAASKYTVKATANGYVANNTTVNEISAGTSATINTTAATGTKTINCVPGYYNKISVNQTNAYDAGYTAGETAGYSAGELAGYSSGSGAGKGFSVWNLPSAVDGSTGTKSLTKTKNLPAGTYRVLIMFSRFGGETQTLTLNYGSTTRTYKSTYSSRDNVSTRTYPSTGSGSAWGEGNNLDLFWQDTFTLSAATEVTMTITNVNSQGGNYRSNAAVASIY